MRRYQIQVITTWLKYRIAFVVYVHLILLRVFYRNLTFLLELRSCKACCTYKSALVLTLNRALQRLHRSIRVTGTPGLRPTNDRHRYKVNPVFPSRRTTPNCYSGLQLRQKRRDALSSFPSTGAVSGLHGTTERSKTRTHGNNIVILYWHIFCQEITWVRIMKLAWWSFCQRI